MRQRLSYGERRLNAQVPGQSTSLSFAFPAQEQRQGSRDPLMLQLTTGSKEGSSLHLLHVSLQKIDCGEEV